MPAGEGLLQWWFDVEGRRIEPDETSVTAWLLRGTLRAQQSAGRITAVRVLRAVRVRRVSRLATSEVTNRPAHPFARLAACLVPASMAGAAYGFVIRRFSSVLQDER